MILKKLQNILQVSIIFILVFYLVYIKSWANKEVEEAPPEYVQQENSFVVRTFDIPAQIDFAGEIAPLDDVEVRQRLDRELHINSYWYSSTVFILKRANEWFPQIEPVLAENNIPEDFKYVALIESGLLNVRSHRDAVGFWQIMEATGKELGLEINDEVDERYNPIKSTEAAAKYFRKAYNKFGNWTNAAASYNMGMTGLQRNLTRQKMDSYYDLHLNEETARYVLRILALKEIIENKEKYGFAIPKGRLYTAAPMKEVIVEEDIEDLVSFAIAQGISYKTLKTHNPWLRDKTLTIKKKGGSYTILIPGG